MRRGWSNNLLKHFVASSPSFSLWSLILKLANDFAVQSLWYEISLQPQLHTVAVNVAQTGHRSYTPQQPSGPRTHTPTVSRHTNTGIIMWILTLQHKYRTKVWTSDWQGVHDFSPALISSPGQSWDSVCWCNCMCLLQCTCFSLSQWNTVVKL